MPEIKDDDREHVEWELAVKTWEELEVIEDQNERLLFPEKLWKRSKGGKFVGVPVAIRVPRDFEIREARVEARRIADEEGFDPAKDPDRFDNLDTLCVLYRCLREPRPPYEAIAMSVSDLEKRFDMPTLEEAYAKATHYRKLIDPRAADITKAELLALIAAIAKGRSIRPLHAFDGRSQDTSIVTMAVVLQSFLERLSSSELSELLTQEP